MYFSYRYFKTKKAGMTGSASFNQKKEEQMTSRALEEANKATHYFFITDNDKKDAKTANARMKAAQQVRTARLVSLLWRLIL